MGIYVGITIITIIFSLLVQITQKKSIIFLFLLLASSLSVPIYFDIRVEIVRYLVHAAQKKTIRTRHMPR